jgi:hypothetical protein
MIIIDFPKVSGNNQMLLSIDNFMLGKFDILHRHQDGVTVLIEEVALLDDLFESYFLVDAYVINNHGGTDDITTVLNIGDELKMQINNRIIE